MFPCGNRADWKRDAGSLLGTLVCRTRALWTTEFRRVLPLVLAMHSAQTKSVATLCSMIVPFSSWTGVSLFVGC